MIVGIGETVELKEGDCMAMMYVKRGDGSFSALGAEESMPQVIALMGEGREADAMGRVAWVVRDITVNVTR